MKEIRYRTELHAILLSPGFLLSVSVLFLNDFYLKPAFGNLLTGKLSDFAGLFAFSLFLAAFFPRNLIVAYSVTASGFLLWKSHLSTFLIDFLNSFSPFAIGRIVDYSDWIAITVLPISYFYFHVLTARQRVNYGTQKAFTIMVLVVSLVVFTATTLVKDRSLYLEGSYLIREKHQVLESALRLSPAISSIKVRRHDEVFADLPNVQIDLKTYFVDLIVERQTCDSKSTLVSFLIEEENNGTVLRGISAEFECRAYESAENINGLDKDYQRHLQVLFQQEILSRLTLVTLK